MFPDFDKKETKNNCESDNAWMNVYLFEDFFRDDFCWKRPDLFLG